jgi:hypothetical protein
MEAGEQRLDSNHALVVECGFAEVFKRAESLRGRKKRLKICVDRLIRNIARVFIAETKSFIGAKNIPVSSASEVCCALPLELSMSKSP